MFRRVKPYSHGFVITCIGMLDSCLSYFMNIDKVLQRSLGGYSPGPLGQNEPVATLIVQ